MRTSNRTKVLEAAIRVINRDGVGALTYETASLESGLTRGGVLYHFPSREALIAGVNEFLVERWEESMAALAGKSAEQATKTERYNAFVRASSLSSSRAELIFMLESAGGSASHAPWSSVLERWAPQLPAEDADDDEYRAFIARLAADGLWIFEAMSHGCIPAADRERVIKRLTAMLKPTELP